MKRIVLATILLIAVLLTACGLQEPTIPSTATAASMNLNVEDLDKPATLTQDLSLPAILGNVMQTPEPDTVTDANQRIFAIETSPISATQGTTPTLAQAQLTSVILIYNSATNAKAVISQVQTSVEEALRTSLPGIQFNPINVTKIGDDTVFAGADLPEQKAQVYILVFRKNNILAVLQTVTPTGAITPDYVIGLATKVLTKIPATTGQ